MIAVIRWAALAAIALALGAAAAVAHEGHSHADEAPHLASPGAAPRAQAVSDNFELVAIAANGALVVFLDRFASNEPVNGAEITVEAPGGSIVAKAADDGTYSLPAPWSERPGKYDLIFTVVAGGAADVLPASIEIGAPASATPAGPSSDGLASLLSAPLPGAAVAVLIGIAIGALGAAWVGRRRRWPTAALPAVLAIALATAALAHDEPAQQPAAFAREAAQRLADGGVFVPKPSQRLLGIRTQVVDTGAHRRTIELPGRIIPDPNASGLVQASAGGRLSPPAGGFPRLGSRVSKGDVIAYVTPPLQTIDRSDMHQRQGELDQQISIVERRIARFESLVEGGAATRVQLEEARLEMQGLKDRRAALDALRAEPEALVAPVAGVIADVNAVAGQMAQPNTILFQIVEPARLWVEALSFDVLSTVQSATVKLGPGRTLGLSYAGAGLADRNQAIPVHFRVDDDTTGLRVGQFVTVLAATDEERQGIAIPRTSVVRTQNGHDMVFEHTAPELFEPRLVRIEPLDGEHVLVSAGVASHARIVTQGAELLEQVR
jgi:hypothetical protein